MRYRRQTVPNWHYPSCSASFTVHFTSLLTTSSPVQSVWSQFSQQSEDSLMSVGRDMAPHYLVSILNKHKLGQLFSILWIYKLFWLYFVFCVWIVVWFYCPDWLSSIVESVTDSVKLGRHKYSISAKPQLFAWSLQLFFTTISDYYVW